MPPLPSSTPRPDRRIRAPRPSETDDIVAVVRAADLLPEAGLAEVRADLDAFLSGAADGGWLADADADADDDGGGGIGGVAYFVPERMTDGTWNLLMLAVHPDRQGRGRGAALVRAVESHLRDRGARLLVIDTSGVPGFAGQRRFYAGLGYEQQGRIVDFFAVGDDKVILARHLDA